MHGSQRSRRLLSTTLAGALGLLSAQADNVLFVIIDDVGWDALKLWNPSSSARFPPTPTINALAARGVQFNRAYSHPTCSPSRASMLTGRLPLRHGIGYAIATPGTDPVLSAAEWTLPEVLTAGTAGRQRLANIGKWHLSFNASEPNTLGGWPHFSGEVAGAILDYERWPKVVNGTTTPFYNHYATTDNVDDALNWVGAQGNNPWLLWLAFNAAHTPYHKPPNALHSYDQLPSSNAAITAAPRPYFEAMTEAMDTELGRLLAGIDTAHTTVVLVGDNGSVGTVIQPPYTANRAKGTLYEGGIRVPMLVAGPAVVHPGRTTEALVHLTDLFPTLTALCGVEARSIVPAGIRLDGRDLTPILKDEPFQPAQAALVSENFGATEPEEVAGRAIRLGRFKWIQFANQHEELYDLDADPTELTNLLASALSAEAAASLENLRRVAASLPDAPQLDFNLEAGTVKVRFAAQPLVHYALERRSSVENGPWQSVTEGFAATSGTTLTLQDTAATTLAAYYRVRVRP